MINGNVIDGDFTIVEADTFTVTESDVIFCNTNGTENYAYFPKHKIEYIKRDKL